jgi:CBS-domain-containing membrane protein
LSLHGRIAYHVLLCLSKHDSHVPQRTVEELLSLHGRIAYHVLLCLSEPRVKLPPNTAVTRLQALALLLEAGVSALPVVDERRCLLDVYARSDITALAQGNAYSRLQWEDVTVRWFFACRCVGR